MTTVAKNLTLVRVHFKDTSPIVHDDVAETKVESGIFMVASLDSCTCYPIANIFYFEIQPGKGISRDN